MQHSIGTLTEFKMVMKEVNYSMRRLKEISVVLFLFVLVLGLGGCRSNNREELNQKISEGELLLSEEKFQEAAIYFETLFDENRDSITLMEKYEISVRMAESREHLAKAEKSMENRNYKEAYENLQEIHPEDQGGLKMKLEIETKIRDLYMEKASLLSDELLFDKALDVVEEYQAIIEDDEIMEEYKTDLLLKISQQEEPAVEEKKIIVLDPGHQAIQNKEKEPLGPGSETMKSKVSSGTRGITTKINEYELNLVVSLKLRDRLIEEGYEVLMTRTSHDVSISNKERAEMANDAEADIFIRIHANGSENQDKKGIMTIYPSADNPFVSHLSEESLRLSTDLHDEMIRETQGESAGINAMDNMVGINWSKIPVSIVELGYMSNAEEDIKLSTEEYQVQLVEGMVKGIQKYFMTDNN